VLGEINLDEFDDAYYMIVNMLFFGSSMFLTIVMLNLLIAIITGIFEEIKSN
jgi:hypothetical protein